MEFDNNKPIYLQIMDSFCDSILSGALQPEDRIQSVREYGAGIGVNPNTVARSYEKLTDLGIIYQKRGIGFFVSADAKEKIQASARKAFIEEELPQFIKKAELLGVNIKDYLK